MSANDSRFKVIAHRCLGFKQPENTLSALRTALESSVDMVEFDVRLTRDRKWVVAHNTFLRSEERVVLKIHAANYTQLRREVTKLDVMLALFAAYGTDKELMIDVKDIGEERQLVRLVQQYDLQQQVIIIAWEPEVLRRVYRIDPSLRLGLSYIPIHSSLKGVKGMTRPFSRHKVIMTFNTEQSFMGKTTKGLTQQHYLSTLPDMPLHSIQVRSEFCSSKLVKLAHERGFKIYAFVVNNRVSAALLRRQGVDGILTNEPKLFVKR